MVIVGALDLWQSFELLFVQVLYAIVRQHLIRSDETICRHHLFGVKEPKGDVLRHRAVRAVGILTCSSFYHLRHFCDCFMIVANG